MVGFSLMVKNCLHSIKIENVFKLLRSLDSCDFWNWVTEGNLVRGEGSVGNQNTLIENWLKIQITVIVGTLPASIRETWHHVWCMRFSCEVTERSASVLFYWAVEQRTMSHTFFIFTSSHRFQLHFSHMINKQFQELKDFTFQIPYINFNLRLLL